jgi:hypothetical protein
MKSVTHLANCPAGGNFACTCGATGQTIEGKPIFLDNSGNWDVARIRTLEGAIKKIMEVSGDLGLIDSEAADKCNLIARSVMEPDWIDAEGKTHAYKCGLNPDPSAMKHMVSHCTCSAAQRENP